MKRTCFRRVGNSNPDDNRPLNIRIRQMLFNGVPLGENPDVKHDFENSSDQSDNHFVDFDSDIHNDVFDKLEYASYISHLNAERSLSNLTTPADPTPADPTPADPTE